MQWGFFCCEAGSTLVANNANWNILSYEHIDDPSPPPPSPPWQTLPPPPTTTPSMPISHPPQPPPPASNPPYPPGAPGATTTTTPPIVVTAEVVVAGVIPDFTADVRVSLRSRVASEIGVPLSAVALSVAAASVRLSFAIEFSSPEVATAGTAVLSQQLSDTSTASAFLSSASFPVSVESITVLPAVTAMPPSSPPPSTSSPADLDGTVSSALTNSGDVGGCGGGCMVLTALAGAAVMLLVVIVGFCLHRRWMKTRATPHHPPSTLAGPGRAGTTPMFNITPMTHIGPAALPPPGSACRIDPMLSSGVQGTGTAVSTTMFKGGGAGGVEEVSTTAAAYHDMGDDDMKL